MNSCEALLALGERVLVVDDPPTGRLKNIEHLKRFPGFECVVDSVMNRALMASLVARADYVLHLAAAVGVRLVVESPVRRDRRPCSGTEIVLELANRRKQPVFLSSTSEVYGKLPICSPRMTTW